jgi:NTE family protein
MMKKKIGLALGSGSVRGFAHIGVLKVLEEEKVPIDFIAGTSIGALIGAAYASGLNARLLEKIALSTEWRSLVDFTVPKTGFIAGREVEKYIARIIEYKNFSELNIPLNIVATDISKGEKVIFDKGNVAKAVRASISIPGVFKPVKLDKKELVDGGLVDPIPVDVVKEMGAAKIIAVDLSIDLQQKRISSKKGIEPGTFIRYIKYSFINTELIFIKEFLRMLLVRIPRFIERWLERMIDWIFKPSRVYKFLAGKSVSPLLNIMIDSNHVLINQLSKEIINHEKIDVMIKPEFKGVRYAEFEKVKDIIKAGEIAARKALPKIRRLVR